MNQAQIAQAAKRFVDELAALAPQVDVNLLLTPDNVVVGEAGISLKAKQPAPGALLSRYPGFTAPEVYAGRTAASTPIYYVGALLYQMLSGSPPPDAQSRMAGQALFPGADNMLKQLVNQATQLDENQRFAGLSQFGAALGHAAQQAAAAMPAAAAPVATAAVAAAPPPHVPVAAAPAPAAPAAPPAPAAASAAPAAPPASALNPQPSAAPAAPPSPMAAAPQMGAAAAPAAAPQQAPAPGAAAGPAAPPPAAPQAGPPQGAPGGAPSAAVPPPSSPGAVPPPSAPGAPPAAPRQGMGMPPQQGMAGGPPRPMQPGGPMAPPPVPPPPGKPKKKKKTGLIIAIVAVVVVALGVGGFFGLTAMERGKVDSAFTEGRYADVISSLDGFFGGFIKSDYQQHYEYSQARLLLTENKTDDALKILDKLGKFEDSEELANATRYSVAEGQLAAGSLDEALAGFKELGDYEDSPERVKEVRYQQAMDLLGSQSFEEAIAIFEELGDYEDSAYYLENVWAYIDAAELTDALQRFQAYTDLGDFFDSAQKAEEAGAELYEEALALYQNEELDEAQTKFQPLGGFKDADYYIEACNIYKEASNTSGDGVRALLPRLQELSSSIDVGPVAMSSAVFMYYVEGYWQSSDGGSFEVTSTTYEFSDYEITGSYLFLAGVMSPYGTPSDRPWIYFEYISYNEITLQVEDGTVHTFTR